MTTYFDNGNNLFRPSVPEEGKNLVKKKFQIGLAF